MLRRLIAVLVIITMASLANCMGKVALTKKVYNFNEGLSPNKYVNNGVFIGLLIIQVYTISLFLDVVIFNPIKFWTGTTIISMEEGKSETQYAEYQGRKIKMVGTRNQMVVNFVDTPEDKTIMRYDPETGSWYMDKESQGLKDFKFADADPKTGDIIRAYHPSGKIVPVQR